MKQETNNEMDLLLRRLSRRGDGGARDGETGPNDRHLDVDELSSYAQNALPSAARARYTEHLVECAPCRKLVTELALSLGAATAAAPATTGLATTGLKAFLASLFSPMVLRYAVPALAVIVVMVVGFVAFRQRQKEDFVAQVALEQKRTAPEGVRPGAVAPPTLDGFHDNQSPKAENQQSPAANRTERKRDGDVSEGAATGAGAAPVTKATDDVSQSETRPAVAAAEPPPAAPKAAAAEAEKETSKEKNAEAPPKKQPETTDFVTDGRADTAKAGTATANERRVSELPVQNRTYGQLQKLRPGARASEDKDATEKQETEKDATETRSVAGHDFKKRRGIWIDTAYDSSIRIRNLARGSESFRALAADEPVINTIAEQLDGEVIVVLKRRAYRIQ